MSPRNACLFFVPCLVACGSSAAGAGGTTPEAEPAPVAVAREPVESNVLALGGTFVATMDVARTSFGATTVGDDVYLAGGYFGQPHRYSREGQAASFQRLTAAHAWEPLAPLDTGLQGLALVTLGGDVVRCGGSRVDNPSTEATDMHSIATCARYRVATNAWEPFPDMPEARSSFDAVALGDRIYAVGGWNVDGDSSRATFRETMLVFDGATSAWRSIASPVQRRALAVTATPGKVIAIGGLRADLTPSRAVDVFDVASESWSSGPEFPGEGFGMSATSVGDVVYASGSDGTLYQWRVGAAEWTPLRTLAQARFFHRLLPQAGAILAIGGIGSMTTDGRARLVEQLPLNEAPPRASWVEISFPGTARNRSGVFARDGSLFVLGGNDSPEQHDFAPTNFVREAFRLHLPSLRWFALEPLPEGRQSLETLVVGDAALAIGGFGHDEDAPRTYADAFAMSEEGAWRMLRDALPYARTQFGIAYESDAVWIFGGLHYDDALPEEERFTHLASVLRCPIDAAALASGNGAPIGTCEELETAMPGTRRAFASAALDGRFYVVGGMRDGFAPIEDCTTFDFAARTFAPLACPAHPRISATLLPLDGRLYLVGGSSQTAQGLGTDRSVEVLDPATGTWSTLIEALPFDTHQGRWTVVGHRLVMIETQHEAGHATVAWVDVAPR
jgi:N-acetylneuraminic acid mutarotase